MKKQSQYDRSAFGVQRAAETNLKKQSQFLPGQNGATSYKKGDYDNNSPASDEENKANQTQFDPPFPHEGTGEREKMLQCANSSDN